jgi:4-amino-4-deoxy-L-arabinose transferase-like glycosyltransferase
MWLVGLAVGARAVTALGVLGSMPIVSDAAAYSDQAATMVQGDPLEGFYWPPGTSYVLAAGYELFGVHPWVARLTMILLGVVAVVTTTLIASRLLRDRRAVLFAGAIVALSPELVLETAQPYAQDLSLVSVNLVVLGALLAYDSGRLRWYALVGFGVGVGTLARPSSLSLLLALAVGLFLWVRALRRAGGRGREIRTVALGTLVAVGLTLVMVFPVAQHNHATAGTWSIALNGEVDLWLANNPHTPNYKTWWLGQHSSDEFPAATRAYMARFEHDFPPTGEQRARLRDEVVRYVGDEPGVTALRTFNRVRAFWGFPYTISNVVRTEWGKPRLGAGLLLLEAGSYILFGLLAIAGAVFSRSMFRGRCMLFVLGTVVAFQLPFMIVFGAGRWHYPVIGLLAPLAGAGLAWALRTPGWWRALLRRRAFVIAALVFLAIQAEYAYFVGTSG